MPEIPLQPAPSLCSLTTPGIWQPGICIDRATTVAAFVDKNGDLRHTLIEYRSRSGKERRGVG